MFKKTAFSALFLIIFTGIVFWFLQTEKKDIKREPRTFVQRHGSYFSPPPLNPLLTPRIREVHIADFPRGDACLLYTSDAADDN